MGKAKRQTATKRADEGVGTTAPAEPRAIVPLLAYQRRAVSSSARFTHANWSRQTGKSFAFGLRRLLRCVETGRLQVCLSAGQRQSKELIEKIKTHCQAAQIVGRFTEEAIQIEDLRLTQYSIEGLPKGGRIIGLPANPLTARGFTGDVLLDEFAMHQRDREIWAALFPTVMRGRGQLDIASTPKGKDNTFARLADNPEFEHSIVTIHDAIRDGLEADAEELRRAVDDEQIWRQEFECEYLDESTAFLTYEQIAGCEDTGLAEPIAVDGRERTDIIAAEGAIAEIAAASRSYSDERECYLGYDVARKRDLAVLWLWERVGDVLTCRLVLELSNTPFRVQYDLLRTIVSMLHVSGVSVDATGMGMPVAERATEEFGSHMVDAVMFNQDTKMKLAEQLRVKVEDRNVRIPATTAIRNDWHSIEKSVTTGGRIRYHADRNKWGHADRFWAAALGVDAATTEGQPWRGECIRRRMKAEGGRLKQDERRDCEEREEARQRKRARRQRFAGVGFW